MRAIGITVGLSAALAFGGCTSVIDWDTFRTPTATIFAPRSVSNMNAPVLKPITAEDLVGADGHCAAPVAASVNPDVAPDGTPAPAALPLAPGGIALQMTECEVVTRAGQPERIQVGTNDRNERTVTLTYINGERPGIYNFTSGRLTAMERAPEPPKPVRPARRGKPKVKAKAKPKTANAT